MALLSRLSEFDVSRLGADSGDPVSHRLRNELWAIVGPGEARHIAQDEQVAECVDDAGCVERPLDFNHEALPVELVEDVQRPEGLTAIGSAMNEVIAPDMVRMLRPEADA